MLSLVIGLVIGVPLSALMLWLSGKIFKQAISYGKAILPALIIWAVGAVFSVIMLAVYDPTLAGVGILAVLGVVNFIIGLALYLLLPKMMFNLEWGKGVLTGLVWWVFMLIVGLIIGMIVMALALAFGLMAAFA